MHVSQPSSPDSLAIVHHVGHRREAVHVNPPVHAKAIWQIYLLEKSFRGSPSLRLSAESRYGYSALRRDDAGA